MAEYKISSPEPSDSNLLPVVTLDDVERVYRMGKRHFTALKKTNLTLYAGQFTAIVGPSGSGKSTLLNMLTGIDKPTSGSVLVGTTRLERLSENALARWRGDHVGIIFQFFQLLPTLTALENVMLPMDFRKTHRNNRREAALINLRLVGLDHHADHLPSELSGGEQQRVAIARAIANDPQIIIADEPTGNLDTATGSRVFTILRGLVTAGKSVILVTHDPSLAALADRIITMSDGIVLSDSRGEAALQTYLPLPQLVLSDADFQEALR